MEGWRFFVLVLLLIHQPGFLLIQVEGQDGFAKTRGVQFWLNDEAFYINGFNAYWFLLVASDPSRRSNVSSAFQQANKYGLTVARTLAFWDGGSGALQTSPGVYNEQTFQALDFVISEAKNYGVKLILSLGNNGDDFGGKKQYVQWAKSRGQNVSSDDDFFVNEVVKGFYKNNIKTVLTRNNTITGVAYMADPTILAWELMNEPRCPSDLTGKTLQDWITEMASYLKSIDPNHLLEVGLEGFYGQSGAQKQFNISYFQVGTDFIANNQVIGIDFATVHSYPNVFPGPSNQTQLAFFNDWNNVHVQDAQNILKMPVLFAEFGTPSTDPGRDAIYNATYSTIDLSAQAGGAAAGGLFWELLVEGLDYLHDAFGVLLNNGSSTATLIGQQSQKLRKIKKMRNGTWKKERDVRKNETDISKNMRTGH
ncbi:Mannan endo-1,4-beta-mannosidase [Bertholletia excelsa]